MNISREARRFTLELIPVLKTGDVIQIDSIYLHQHAVSVLYDDVPSHIPNDYVICSIAS